MEQSSPFAQRLRSISERSKLQELILNTRLDLEQEKLRAQRLKRKSLREQWLREGTSVLPDDLDPLSPLRESETRIEELQQSLARLQVQMQQLDNSELWKVPQEPPLEESVRDVDEANQSLDGPEKVDGIALSSSEGRNEAKSTLESAPASPRSAVAKENLQNGEMRDGGLFGNECSPEESKVKAIPVAMEKGVPLPHQDSFANAAADSVEQHLDPSKAPTSRQRKLAMEEIVIRDHLGQEVGCMDAVGQNQNSLEKEEEPGNGASLGDSGDHGSQPGPVGGASVQKNALEDGPLDHELSSRDDPEGQSPTQDLQGPSGLPQNENSDPTKGQGDRALEMGSLAKETSGKGVAQKVEPGQGTQEMEPALALPIGEAPTAESVEESQGSQMKTLERQESGAREEGQQLAAGSHLNQGHAQTTSLAEWVISPLPEVEPFILEQIPSSEYEMGKPIAQQGQELFRHEVEGSLPGTTPSLTDQLTSLPDQTVSLPGTIMSAPEEPPAPLQDQRPVTPEAEVSPLPEADVFHPSQILLPVDDPGECPIAFQEQISPVLQDTGSASPVAKTPASSLQEVDGTFMDEIQTTLPIHTLANLPEDEGSSPAPPTLEDQVITSPLGQAPSLQDTVKAPPEGQDSSHPPEERSPLAEQTSSPNKAQSPLQVGASLCPSALPLSSQETLQPLLDKTEMLEMLDAKKHGDAGVAAAGETMEALGNLPDEQQPLLKDAVASGVPLDMSAGDPQSEVGNVKPLEATSQPAPSNSTHPNANTADSLQAQAALPYQGRDRESVKGKRKTCQCCVLM